MKYLLTFLLLFQQTPKLPIGDRVPEVNRQIKQACDHHYTDSIYFHPVGWFTAERQPMLVTDPALLRRNTPLADSDYILLTGAKVESLAKDSKYKNHWMRILITGKLPEHKAGENHPPKISFTVLAMPRVVSDK